MYFDYNQNLIKLGHFFYFLVFQMYLKVKFVGKKQSALLCQSGLILAIIFGLEATGEATHLQEKKGMMQF